MADQCNRMGWRGRLSALWRWAGHVSLVEWLVSLGSGVSVATLLEVVTSLPSEAYTTAGAAALFATAAGLKHRERRKAEQEVEKKASPKSLEVSVRAHARHALLNWTPAHEQTSSGSVRCKVYSGDGDKRYLDSCQVTSPDEAVSVARTIPREPQAFFAFDYPSQFEGSVPTLPLPDGEYRVEWNEVGGGLIRIHAFTIVKGRLAGDGSTP